MSTLSEKYTILNLALAVAFCVGFGDLAWAGITITPEPGFDVTWDGNDGDNFDSAPPPGGAMAPDNVALAVNGGVPIGSEESQFTPTHAIAKLNDGFYGNSNSHINGPNVSPAWSGIILPGQFEITSFAFGRDNGNGEFDDSIGGTDACGGQCSDRWGAGGDGLAAPPGDYLLQITNDGGGTWTDVATLTYDGAGGDIAPGGAFTPWLRHEFEVSQNGGLLVAGGMRLMVPGAANNVAIDEFEIYGSQVAVAVLNPVEEGGEIAVNNLAGGGTAFAKDVAAGRSVAGVNDETFGDGSSWSGATADSFVGINFGATATPVSSVAFGRDNTGGETDGWIGEYTLQFTDVPNPDASTPDGSWTIIGTIPYADGSPTNGHLRHRFNFGQVSATGIRLLTPDGAVIDELEVYENLYVPPPPPALTITPAPGFTATWDGNDGDHFDQEVPPGGALAPDNLALASNGAFPFGSEESQFLPAHQIVKLNDGFYGNSNSHINGPGASPAFFGIALPQPTALTAIAWGRDNGNGAFDDSFGGSDACGGQCDDRSVGFYILQFTTVPEPDELTPDQDWIEIAEFEYTGGIGTDNEPGGLFTEWLRHQYEIGVSGGGPIVATGVRIVIPAPHPPNDIAIDELELYGVAAPTVGPTLNITHDPSTGDLTLRWNSRDGRLYNVRSEADLSAGDPIGWPIFGANQDLVATPPENSLSFPLPPESARFFVVEEFPAPPESVFADDFEGGQGGWTTGSDRLPGTDWELGTPTNVGPGAANSPVNAYGTNIGANYADDAEIWLRSPPIDLTNAAEATLSFSQFRDIETMFDSGAVRILDASDDSLIEEILSGIEDTSADWEDITKAIPAAALGRVIKIEFRFTSDDFTSIPQAGWYIDDVNVTIP